MRQRELKFRAWDFQHSRWATNNDVSGSVGLDFDSEAYFLRDGDNHSDRWRFLQFTGLKDSAEKEVHEGDIVRCYLDKYTGEIIGEIKWSPMASQWWITWNNGTSNYKPLEPDYGDEDGYKATYIEVIGNIYENPELLNLQENPQ